MKKLNFLFLLFIIISCKKSSEANRELSTGKTEFKILSNSNFDINSLDIEGEIVEKRFWKDLNGRNVMLFTQTETTLFAYHYIINSKKPKLINKITDSEKECDADLILNFDERSISITDIDKDNLGEITFTYQKACMSDVSPKELYLIMLENKAKYIINGQTAVFLGNEKLNDAKITHTDFNDTPADFLLHANKTWDKASGK